MASFSHSLGHVCTAAAAARQGQTLWVAVATPDHTVHVYSRNGEEGFARQAELECHEAPISGLEFCSSGAGTSDAAPLLRLVSSSHDRNSYVWTQQRSSATSEHPAACSWQPELVITRLRRAGLCVAWSPCGRKYAIGGSERVVDVLYWAEDKELWAPKLIRKQLECAAMAVAWHPSGALVATAGTDCKLRLFNAMVPGVDGPSASWPALGVASKFGDCLLELPLPGGWGLAVAFSPDGATLAAASQGSQLTLLPGLDLRDPASLEPAAAAGRAQHMQLDALPLKCLAFLSDTILAGAGFDCHPLLFRRQPDGRWQRAASLRGMKAGSSSTAGAAASSLMARVKLFEQHAATASAMGAGRAASADKENSGRGGVPGSSEEEEGGSGPHHNTIISIVPLAGGPLGRLSMLTASLEGCLAEWHVTPSLL